MLEEVEVEVEEEVDVDVEVLVELEVDVEVLEEVVVVPTNMLAYSTMAISESA